MTAAADSIAIWIMIPERTARRATLFGGVGIVVAAVGGWLFTRGAHAKRDVDAILADLAVIDGYRAVEPRLTIDFPYQPFRSSSTSQRMQSLRARPSLFYEVVTQPIKQRPALTQLLLGEPAKAIKTLHNDGHANGVDLAAAHYMSGTISGSLYDFARALQAISDAPPSPPAQFNRALIIDQFADPEAAATEWKKYLALDGVSPWADEARQRLAADSRPSTPQSWLADKPLLLDAAFAGNTRRVRELTGRYPVAARRLVQSELLPGWGDAWSRGNAAAAERLLVIARRCTAILDEKGDHLLRDALAEIDACAPEQKRALANSYAAYGAGSAALDNGAHDAALERFAAARARAGSPLAALVSEATATTLYRQYKLDRAQVVIDQARADYARSGYITLEARLNWLAGLIQIARGGATDAIRSYETALAAYSRMGENEYIAGQHVNLVDALSYVGDSARAGMHLRQALLYAGNAEDPSRLMSILAVAADSTLDEAAPAAALLFQDRLVRMARASGKVPRIAHALVTRSETLSRCGRRAEALRDLAEVAGLADSITDLPSRQRLQADAAAAAAFAHRQVDDEAAIQDLSTAIERYRAVDLAPLIPQLLLERGRARIRRGVVEEGERDFRAGVDALEHDRRLVTDSDQRITYFDKADQLFVELALLQLRRGRTEDAFDLLERSRSRELLDRSSGAAMLPLPVSAIRKRLPANATLVTYTVTADALLTFVVTRDGVRATQQPAGAQLLESLIDEVRAGFTSPVGLSHSALRRLGHLLIDGVPANGGPVIFVPDQLLHSLPFGSLRTASGRYLVEEHVNGIAPSATLFVTSSARAQRLSKQGAPSLLAVASPAHPDGFDDLEPLSSAPDEARRIAQGYARQRLVIIAQGEQPKGLLDAARDFDVLHFAAHSVTDHRDPKQSAMLLGSHDRVSAEDIEKATLPHVRLVVLGGCNTGRGQSHRSEGVMSLARAFMAASVPAVVGTIARIDDAAAERLLVDFHQAYRSELDPATALCHAQLRALRSGDPQQANPARWAAFQVIGGSYTAP